MRQRKRDWPQRVYKYHVDITSDIPESFWQHAHKQKQLWNDLCVLGALTAGQVKLKDGDKAWKDLCWRQFRAYAEELVIRSGLDWETGPDVLDRYKAACRGIGRNGKGPPRQHYRLRKVRMPHRFTGGGIEASRLWSPRQTRCRLTQLSSDGSLASLDYKIDDSTTLTALVVMHRPIPDGVIVKGTALCGVHTHAFAWSWTLNITVEVPPEHRSAAVSAAIAVGSNGHGRGCAGIDVGWRKRDGHLRIGMVADDSGNVIELRLPLCGDTRSTRRAGLPSSWYDVAEYQRERDLALEECKARLRELSDRLPAGFAQMRHGGLKKWQRELEPADERREIIAAWRKEDLRINRRQHGLRLRLIRRRNHRYRELAKWLCERYAVLAVEQDLPLKELAETSESYAAANAQQYRMWASLSTFRRYLTEAAEKYGTALLGTREGTSSICATCGSAVEQGEQLRLRCASGHEFDRDVNAARRLLSQIKQVEVQDGQLRRNGGGASGQVVEIPQQLRAVTVPCV